VTNAEQRLLSRVEGFENHRKQFAAQRADDSHGEIVDATWPEISAEHGERGYVALHLPARSDAPGKFHVVGDYEYGRLIHCKFPFPFLPTPCSAPASISL